MVAGRGLCPGEAGEEQECGAGRCPAWGEWTDWTPCTRTCGGGQRTKQRECIARTAALCQATDKYHPLS